MEVKVFVSLLKQLLLLMEIPLAYCLLLILQLIISSTIDKTFSSSIATDQNTLLSFKNTLTITSDPHDILAKNWTSNGTTTSVCYWIGVSCGSKHRRVTALDVSGFGLSGALPPHLGNLTFLRYLDISSNNFAGPVPHELSRLHRLREINASHNFFAGKIPPWFGDLPRLEILSLSNNAFGGEIPREIGSLSMLKRLYLGSNVFEGGIPAELGRLSRLETLSIRKASLTGSIPNQIGNCTSLRVLNLSDNNLTGLVPNQIGNYTSINLNNNNLTGRIPNQIGNCTYLALGFNQLTGAIPNQIWNYTYLKVLDLSNNHLSGSLPLEWSLFNLEVLLLYRNQLSGEIPSSITNASKLTILQLNRNSFVGSIPNFGSLRLLQRLQISGNNLSGSTYPDQELEFYSWLTNCQFLEVVDVSGIPLNGILPTSIGNLSKSLYAFGADYCNITGAIPSSIGNLTGLQMISMSYNRFTGFIPPTIGKLNQLQGLFLYGDQLQGYIPYDLCRLNSIFELNLGDNFFTGPIPECFGEMNSLENINIGSNNLNSTIPSKIWYLKALVFVNLSSNYLTGQLSSQIGNLKTINGLDISHNQFSGVIPGSIESCQSLEYLLFSNNKFEGFIPPSLGNMRGLKTLDLSNNNLSGLIPNSFQGLNSLQQFNVSYNNLEGEIPTGGPFVNFTAQSFLNNYALCGVIQFQVSPCPINDSRTSKRNEVVRLMKYILPPFVLVSSLATIVILVLLRRQKRKRNIVQTPVDVTVGATWRRVSYIEIVRGTNSFSTDTNLLGRGSFGSVFKATLPDELVVAVKVFNSQSERAIQSFDTECEILSTVRHRNLVQVIGCCSNTEFKALILEHMPYGSLEKWLHSENNCLNLTQRLKIAIEVALALEYLHHGHTFQIVHCDIKPSNVLLDEDMVAHLADFGISKLFEDGETMVHTKTLATIGYASPEYGSEGKVSTNGDVYSYGILLLEMFTKKKPTDDMFNGEMSLREWVYRALQVNAIAEVVAPDLLLSIEDDESLIANKEEWISSVFNLAMQCLVVTPVERIDMTEIVRALQRIKAKVMKITTKRRRYA